MAVYVDEPIWLWRGRLWCHLTADATDELHAFAAELGLERSWLQSRPGRPWRDHYDIPDGKRRQAVALGAIELTFRQAAEQLGQKRTAGAEGARD